MNQVRLSIFNFNVFLSKTIILFILFVIAYTCILAYFNPTFTKSQNQLQDNIISAQEFIYSDKPPRVVILGSSMSRRLVSEQLNDDVYNLSLNGEGVSTGLAILQLSGITPKVILVEANVIDIQENHKLLDRLFDPSSWLLKSKIPVLRDKYQPINILVSSLSSNSEYLAKKRAQPINMTELNRWIKIHLANERSLEEWDNKSRHSLLTYLQHYKRKGAHIIFFFMPNNNAICQSTRWGNITDVLNAQFSNVIDAWIDKPNCEKYQTRDAIHLTYSSALLFSEKLNLSIPGSNK